MKKEEEILKMANMCLNCKTKPCHKACPMQTNIPEFINSVKDKEYENAYNILIENNLFSHVCSLVCPQEEQCEGSCVRGIKGEPTRIGKLEQFVNEWAKQNRYEYHPKLQKKNGKKIAIIGSGPSGLCCAYELLKNGFDVDIFEKNEKFGGILTYGIPDFRLPKQIVEHIIEKIRQMGGNLYANQILGENITIQSLFTKYSSIFLGIGAGISMKYALSEENLNGIYDSDIFLKHYSDQNHIKDLGKVVVIGGGNVAMDCARTAMKMGAKEVKILYRRDKAHMPAREEELKDALEDGVEIEFLTRVISAEGKNGRISILNCIRTEIKEGKAVDRENTEFQETADTFVFAIGLKPDKEVLEKEKIELDEWGFVKVDENMQTNLKNVYAGGDVMESKSTVCRALAAGKKAAEAMIKSVE